ncbi:MAG: class II fructose-bisphosphate aldolase [Candidatus Jorgensenbacteria bacterium]|nr:class II fructose-bisphosphate aldolase [Candidatus Jorgensenbacteria bacterium]
MRSLAEVIKDAEKKKIAIGHFNVSNLEQLNAIVGVVRKLNVSVIVGVSEGEREFIGVDQVVALIESFRNEGLEIYLNADHTHSTEKVREAVEAGFDAVLFDGGKLPLDENIKQTQEAIHVAKSIASDVLVEGELGYIGGGSEILEKLPEDAAISAESFTKPEDAQKFVKETSIDLLAPAVGNVHGMFKNAPNPRLDIPRIRAIKQSVNIPLVLHGGSGISDEDFISAIDAGISIIHISTELRAAWRSGVEHELEENKNEVAPYKVMADVVGEMEKVIEKKLRLFNRTQI